MRQHKIRTKHQCLIKDMCTTRAIADLRDNLIKDFSNHQFIHFCPNYFFCLEYYVICNYIMQGSFCLLFIQCFHAWNLKASYSGASTLVLSRSILGFIRFGNCWRTEQSTVFQTQVKPQLLNYAITITNDA